MPGETDTALQAMALAETLEVLTARILAARQTPPDLASADLALEEAEAALNAAGPALVDGSAVLSRRLADLLQMLAWPGLNGRLLAFTDLLISRGHRDPMIEASRCQALCDIRQPALERGGAETARRLIRARLAADPELETASGPAHTAALWIMLGRAEKDLFTAALDLEDHARALRHGTWSMEAYGTAYNLALRVEDDRTWLVRWPGNSFLAVGARMRREGLTGPVTEQALETLAKGFRARQIRIVEEGRPHPATAWDYITMAEIELNYFGGAEAADPYLARFAELCEGDAFALGGALRQFETVHAVPGPAAARQRQFLRSLVAEAGGEIQLPARALKDLDTASELDATYEAILGKRGPTTYAEMRAVMKSCQSVASVRMRSTGRRIATGFLVDLSGAGLGEGRPVFVTNAHVCEWPHDLTPEGRRGAGLAPEDLVAEFELMDQKLRFDLAPIVTSPRTRFDVTVLALSGEGALPPALPAHLIKAPTVGVVYVIGFPGGRELSLSLQGNDVVPPEELPVDIRHSDDILYHLAPTEKGNSGSPVLMVLGAEGEGRQVAVVAVHSGAKIDRASDRAVANRASMLRVLERRGAAATSALRWWEEG